jgi:hypothetical protein
MTNIPQLNFKWKPQNKMVICSVASGAHHIQLMQLMAPTVHYYAHMHNMDCMLLPLTDIRLEPSRPAAWDKIVLINHALKMYDMVMWIDSDTIIVDPSQDIRAHLDPNYVMHLVGHHIRDRFLANTGVWICRKDPRVFDFLEAIWNHVKFINTLYYENGALIDLLGYDPYTNKGFRGVTPFTPLVQFLDEKWNNLYQNEVDHPIIIHFTGHGGKKPIEKIEEKYNEFLHRIWQS